MNDGPLTAIIERVKKEIDLRQLLVDEGWDAKILDKKYVAINCPFHQDTHPSLYIYSDENRWWCFGCNTGGSNIDWIMRYNHLEFSEAVKYLAFHYLGIDAVEISGTKARLDQLEGKVNYLEVRLEEHIHKGKKKYASY